VSAAAKHVLNQMQRDGRLAWLIGPGSQSYELLTSEAAASEGRPIGEFQAEYELTLTTQRWPSVDDIQDCIDAAVAAALEADRSIRGNA